MVTVQYAVRGSCVNGISRNLVLSTGIEHQGQSLCGQPANRVALRRCLEGVYLGSRFGSRPYPPKSWYL